MFWLDWVLVTVRELVLRLVEIALTREPEKPYSPAELSHQHTPYVKQSMREYDCAAITFVVG